MTWQFFILVSVVLYSVSVVLQRMILKEDKSRPITYAIVFQFLTGVVIGVFGFLFADMSFPKEFLFLWPNLALMVLLYGFSNVLIFKALKEMEASKFTIIFTLRAFVTVVASSFLLSEFLSGGQLLGALFVFVAVVLVNLKKGKFTFGRVEMFALLGAVAFGVANTNDRYLLQFFNVYPYVSFGFVAPAVLMAFVYPKELSHVGIFLNKKVFSRIVVLSVFYALSAVTFFFALQVGENSSQVVSVNITSVIVTVLLSIVFLRERESISKKLLGALLSFAGLLLLV